MNYHYFGDSIDIHGGGNDLIFPHHENEIAQSELFTGKPFARYWVHNGMLQLRGEKMSKSLGNIISIDEFLTQHSADSFRYLILNSAYRNPIIFNDDVLMQAEKALDRVRFAFNPAVESAKGASDSVKQTLSEQINATRNGFINAMDDDFNSAGALGNIFELIRVINYSRDEGATQLELQPAQDLLMELTNVLGLTLADGSEKKQMAEADPFVQLLVDLRLELRKQKNWGLADQIRNQLFEKGVVLEDTKDGTTWHWDRRA